MIHRLLQKPICFGVVVTLLLSMNIMPAFASYVGGVDVSLSVLFDGVLTETPPLNAKTVTVQAMIKNSNLDQTKPITVCIALYNAANKLENITLTNDVIQGDNKWHKVTTNMTLPTGGMIGRTVKGLAWDTQTISPYAEAMKSALNAPSIEYAKEESSSAGIVNDNGVLTLDTKYKQPHKFNIYYGELKYSGIYDYSDYDFLIVYDRNVESVAKVRSQGCEIFQYLYFGSRFEDTDSYIENFKSQVLDLKNTGLADGIFLDECDVNYWELGYSSQPDKCQIFYNRLKEATDYCRSIGIQTVVNGSRAFCDLGDYFLWESFQGYWTTNSLTWSNATTPRQTAETGEVSYGRTFSDWTLTGSCYYDGQSIRGGSNGTAEILIDMDTILQEQDKRDFYDWVYFEWFGEGANDNNCDIWVWTGDELPFNENSWDGTWRKLPKLWKGEPSSWNGIGKSSKYTKVKMVFHGADNLKLDSILLTYNYNYPSWDMSISNGEADTNPFMWNYNNSQRDYLLGKMNSSGNKVKVLTHTYGAPDDEYRKRYNALGSAISGFYSNDYVHPMMQSIYENNPVDEPMGMLLYRRDNTGYFTGGSATINTVNHTYTLDRNEPGYWYNKAAVTDGNTNEWNASDTLYTHTGPSFGAYTQWWGAGPTTYNSGAFNNTQVVNRSGYDVLELITDGSGSWISPVIQAYTVAETKSIMNNIIWNGSGASYSFKYKHTDGTWTDWTSLPTSNTVNIEFTEFQVKVGISGQASYTTEGVFHQGASFWGSSHTWNICLPDNINVQNFMMTDDSKYIYFSYQVAGQIDFSQNPNLPSDYNYYIYLDTLNDATKGYSGTWWTTPFGSNYRIGGNGIFKWNDSYTDRTDSNGWEWMGSAGMTYKLSADKKTIEYRIKKESLGGLEAEALKVFMNVEDSKTFIGNLINPITDGNPNYSGAFNYTQKSYQAKTPHGWYCSEEQDVNVNDGYVTLSWYEDVPEGTAVKAWLRTRGLDSNWSEWQEVTNKQMIYGSFAKVQYCIGLYTNDGKATPRVSLTELSSKDTMVTATGNEYEQTFSNLPNLTPPQINDVNIEVLNFEKGIYRLTIADGDYSVDANASPFFFWSSEEGTFSDATDNYRSVVFHSNAGMGGRMVRVAVGLGDALGRADKKAILLKGSDQ